MQAISNSLFLSFNYLSLAEMFYVVDFNVFFLTCVYIAFLDAVLTFSIYEMEKNMVYSSRQSVIRGVSHVRPFSMDA